MQRNRTLAILLVSALLLAAVGTALADGPRNFRAHLAGGNEVPAVATLAQGQATFQLSADGTELSYRLIVANINNVVASHIHLAPEGVNGPVVAFLAGPFAPAGGRTNGVLAEGVITAGNLLGPLAGQPLSALVEALEAGGAYVNVHTNDGIAPTNTGAGDVASGEIRGQIR